MKPSPLPFLFFLLTAVIGEEPTRPGPDATKQQWVAYLAAVHREAPTAPKFADVDFTSEQYEDWDGGRYGAVSKRYFVTRYEIVCWPEDWADALGKALYVQASTDRRAGVWMLSGRRSKTEEERHYLKAQIACKAVGIPLTQFQTRQNPQAGR